MWIWKKSFLLEGPCSLSIMTVRYGVLWRHIHSIRLCVEWVKYNTGHDDKPPRFSSRQTAKRRDSLCVCLCLVTWNVCRSILILPCGSNHPMLHLILHSFNASPPYSRGLVCAGVLAYIGPIFSTAPRRQSSEHANSCWVRAWDASGFNSYTNNTCISKVVQFTITQ